MQLTEDSVNCMQVLEIFLKVIPGTNWSQQIFQKF
jgi:hypothetical protein